jgi:uncharacterized membrane protein
MGEPNEQGHSLLQLAMSLRLAAQRLALSANRMQEAAEHQRQQLERLTLLRDRIIELLAVCRRLADKQSEAAPSAPSAPAAASQGAVPPSPRPEAPKPRLPASAFVEFSNWQEFEKFRRMPPISDAEFAACDLDELIRRLSAETGSGGLTR